MKNIIDTLEERGFISQTTHNDELRALTAKESVGVYLGIDPTFKSLHIGHLTPVFMLRHFHDAGHKVTALMGGGTGRIGDPSGKTEMRKLLSYEEINHNVEAITRQLSGILNFNDARVAVENNADWLAGLNYIDFLRDIGRHFSVNKMLTYEAYKKRMETGLSFIEFNYLILQSYDFYMLNRQKGIRIQIGGDDQWGNITAGIDLIRRMGGEPAYGVTCPLITRADGKKMGKSEKGAVFLDPSLTSPYEMFQYWRNVDDRDVRRFLLLYTFLPVAEIDELTQAAGSALNTSKVRLAYEYVKLIHGEEEAEKARQTAASFFGGTGGSDNIPAVEAALTALDNNGISLIELYVTAGLCSSKSEARRLIEQGGASVNDQKITDAAAVIDRSFLSEENTLTLRAGKKKFARLVFR
jgi:tyrosyl-tRNA synthetase